MPEIDARQWTELIEQAPHAHLLQTAPWGDLKASFGWTPVRVISPSPGRSAAGAQVLFRRLLPGLTFAYLPKGPLWLGTDRLAAWNELLPELDAACRRRGAVFLKIEPDEWEPVQAPIPPGFSDSPHPIQPRRTLLVDLRGSDEELLARMKQKTRYNIRLSLKKGVLAHPSSDLDAFYRLIQETGGRDQFGVHSYAYYRRVYDLFHPAGLCELFLASHAGEPLAGLLVFARGSRAYYFYGASASQHRERMPTYLLQWESMRWARSRGCQEYDLWGVPDEDEEVLERDFSTRSDGLWGVYRFKRGFGGQLCRSAAPIDRVYIRPLYRLYMQWVKRRGLAG